MKKTKDITKYNIKWQILRAKIKGPGYSLNEKLTAVEKYFREEQTIDAYERVLNFLEGLQKGYIGKNPKAAEIVESEISEWRHFDSTRMKKESSIIPTTDEILEYSFGERFLLWKDLFKRNQKWLEKGYNQKELNNFMDLLYKAFQDNKEDVGENYSYKKLQQLRKSAESIENTHKFFF